MKAKYILYIITIFILYYGQTTAQTRSLNTSLLVGSTAGSFNVSQIGAATYTIPIFTPPGTAGMQPGISITYSSQTGNGMLGQGWNIAGLSAITRIPKNYYYDGDVTAISLNTNDKFALDGNRLIATSDTQYRTEIETFANITSYGSLGTGPQWFKVETKDGKILEYGNSTGSYFQAQNQDEVVTWYLNKITDSNGNYIIYTYQTDRTTGQMWIERIDYTGSATFSPYNSIQFVYKTRQDSTTAYIAGNALRNQKILDKISVFAGSTLVREYSFTYTLSNNVAHLNEIFEKNGSSQQFNSTLINWNTPETVTSTTLAMDYNNFNYIFNDYNGDHFTDYLKYPKKTAYSSTDKLELYVNNKSGGFTKATWELFLSGAFNSLPNNPSRDNQVNGLLNNDFNNDGKADFLFIEKKYWGNPLEGFPMGYYYFRTLYTSNGTGFTSGLSELLYDDLMGTGDLNGNGTLDMIVYEKKYNSLSIANEHISRNIQDTLLSMRPIDFNGDGKSDLLVKTQRGIWKILTLARNGSSYAFTTLYSTTIDLGFDTWGDFNGDGKTDYLAPSADPKIYTIFYSTGSDLVNSGLNFGSLDISGGNTCQNQFSVSDLNGDGVTDIFEQHTIRDQHVECERGSCGLVIQFISERGKVYLMGTSSVNYYQLYYKTSPYLNNKEPFFYDFDGDGGNEIIDETLTKVIYPKLNPKLNLVNSITNGFNNTVTINYSPLTNGGTFYSPLTTSVFPLFDFKGPLYAVDNIISDNGSGSTNVTYYQYSGARIHKQGKGFLGFSKVTSYSNITGLKQENIYDFNNSYFYVYLKKSKSLTTSGTEISEKKQTMSFHNFGNHRFFPYMSADTSYDRLANTTILSTASYNTSGDLLSSYINNNGLATKTINYQFYNNLGQPGSVITTSSRTGQLNIVAKDSFQYYNTGLLKVKITEPGDTSQVYTNYSYDNFGNVTQVKTSPNGVKGRVVYYAYDTKGRMRTKTYNTANHFTKDSCDFTLGVVLESRDHNNLVTQYGYDGFGRLIQTTEPNGNVSAMTYEWITGTTPSNAVYSITNTTPGASSSRTYYDKLGRAVCSEITGLSGTKILSETSFNPKGEVVYTTKPYFQGTSNADRISYTYDFLSRVKTEIGPGIKNSYNYTGLTTTVTDNLKMQSFTRESDATGLTKKATDTGGDITYIYNAVGQQSKVNIAKNGLSTVDITMGYDKLGHQTVLRDPNAGAFSYLYNTYGELTQQTDTLNNVSSVAYDSLGRATAKIHSDYNFTYFYNTKGLTDSIRSSNVSNIFFYDTLNRVKVKTDRVKGMSLKTKYAYDNYGRMDTVIYPSGFAITYHYKNGYLEEIKRGDNGTSIWKITATNAVGQIVTSVAGNNLVTTKTYNNKGALLTIATGLNSSIQNLEYSYYQNGLMESRTDKRHNSINEGFYYDEMNRLETIYNYETGANKGTSYDNSGKITFKSGIGNYTYNNTASQAIKQIEYNGGVSPEREDISYTSFNKIRTISKGGNTSSFTYGTDYQRCYVESVINGTTIKKYYTDNYEKTVIGSITRELNYIFAGGQLVAIFVKNGSTDSMYYVHTDHLGSLNVITNASGTIVNEMSFDAWGNRRDPATWQIYKATPAGLITERGFTGHEHMDAFSLINMNGRVYDPALGVFLSPDNYVQAPGNSQSYNRYAYCMNNPLMFTDPSGELAWFIPMIIGAVTGGATNAIQNAGNIHNFWDFAGYFGEGAVHGAMNGLLGGLAGGSTASGLQISGAIPGALVGGLTGAVTGGAISLFGNGINNINQGHNFWNNWKSSLGQGMISGGLGGAISGGIAGYEMALGQGKNVWWGTKPAYHRTQRSFAWWDKPDKIVFSDVKNRGAGKINCMAKTFQDFYGETEAEWNLFTGEGNELQTINQIRELGGQAMQYPGTNEIMTYDNISALNQDKGRAMITVKNYQGSTTGHAMAVKKIISVPGKRFDAVVFDPYKGSRVLIRNFRLGTTLGTDLRFWFINF